MRYSGTCSTGWVLSVRISEDKETNREPQILRLPVCKKEKS